MENCIHLLKAEPDSGTDTCPQSHDKSDCVDRKAEDIIDMQEEENSLKVECPMIKSDLEITHQYTHTHTHTHTKKFILQAYAAKKFMSCTQGRKTCSQKPKHHRQQYWQKRN
jgi:hypothetical protein